MKLLLAFVVGTTILLGVGWFQRVAAFEQEYACQCKRHAAGARGPSRCSLAETEKYCEIVYGLPPVLSQENRDNIAKRLDKLTKDLGLPAPLTFTPEDEALIEQISPKKWGESDQKERIGRYLVTTSVFPLLYRDESDDVIMAVSKLILADMDKVIDRLGKPDPEQMSENITAGSGCLLVRYQDVRIVFNSGWYVRKFEKGWSCAWAGGE